MGSRCTEGVEKIYENLHGLKLVVEIFAWESRRTNSQF